ncbi:MAG: diheme cytochrome c-553 [Deltaproteobacteria bacterium]|nr:diheme cytochrome c-553 [Deltaproteobacteria bacterium]MCK5709123.1 diheme cytochrome c-553 [Deltaproteobacteria bacterium]
MLRKLFLITLILLIPITFVNALDNDSVSIKESQVKRGKQLVNQGRCNDCHTPLVETKDGLIPDKKRTLSGHPSNSEMPQIPAVEIDSDDWLKFLSSLDSTVWAGKWGISFSANLTPDPMTGIGKWNEEVFIEIMRSGRHVDLKRNIKPSMPWKDYAKLSDEDLKSIFVYLETLPPIRNAVPKPIPLPLP